ncbi:MAG TPA: class I SAM-dependent methyltransferase [Xanthomonadales bacterium]|nr:class I SAM-dependent methyltransferase [Xanthomonadales bacterium]
MFSLFRRRPRCNACGRRHRDIARIGEFAPTQHGPFHADRFALEHCALCDVVFLDPQPTPGDLRAMYEQAVQFTDEVYTAPERAAAVLDYLTTSVTNWQMLPRAGERVLEVGAGVAWMCRTVKQLRPDVITMAQDVTGEVATACPWVDRYVVGTAESCAGSGPFALISLTHVIEHLVDPKAMLRTLAGMLATDGYVFITAPYRPVGWQPGDGAEAWRAYPYLHVPAHVNYLSRAWFEQSCAELGLQLKSWDAGHDGGQAFEVVLTR